MPYLITTATKKIASLRKRIRIVQGGTSASKTISILIWLIDRAQRKYKSKAKELTSIVSESIPHLKRGVIRDFKNILIEQGVWKDEEWNATDFIYTFKETGHQIEFFSTDNADKLRGARRDWLFMNEANNCTFEAFEQLEVRTKRGVFIDYNPTNEFWVQAEIQPKRDDVDFIILTYKDNEALSEEIIKSIEQRRNRPSWWKVYGEGQLGEVEGRIFTNWPIIDQIPHEARLERHGLDFGYHPDPATIVDVYYYNGGYILDEVLCQVGLRNADLAQALKNLPAKLTIADCAEPKSIDEIRMYGVSIMPCEKGADSLKHGIAMMQDQQISVTKRSVNLIKEYRNYLWKTDKDGNIIRGVPDGGNDHCLDAARYAMSSLIPFIQRKQIMENMPRLYRHPKKNPAR